jgi:heme-degrading monooxygenase HmoA
MILELASITISDGRQQEFESALVKGKDVLKQAEGYVGHEFKKCMEVPNRYILLITWQSLEAHTEVFRKSELFKEWRALIGGFFAESPEVLHYESF